MFVEVTGEKLVGGYFCPSSGMWLRRKRIRKPKQTLSKILIGFHLIITFQILTCTPTQKFY